MLHKPQEVVEKLGSYDAETRLLAVRSLKNEIIGSKSKKLAFIGLGAVPQVVKILSSETEGALLVQAAAALGSFAYGTEEGVRAVLDSQGVAQLLDTLSNDDEKVIESGVRSLKMLLQSGLTPRDPIFVEPALHRLVSLLSMQKSSFGRLAACVLARCCKTKHQQDAFVGAGALPGLLKLLESPNRNCQEAALDALSALSRKNDDVCQSILESESTEKILTRFTKDRSPRVKLLACSTLTNLSSCLTPEELAENSYHQHKHILQVLVKLLNETTVKDQVPEVLSRLTERSQELQRAAYEADAVRRLYSFLEGPCSSQMKEGILRCLSTLCMDLQECRKQIQDSKAIKPILAALEDPVAGVRAAAACCVRAMTRSVKDLRADWIDEATTTPLVKLLSDPDTDVQENACSTLCNLLLEFTRVKQLLLDQGLRPIIALTQSMDAKLRSGAVWALKNLSYQLEVEKGRQVLRELPWQYVRGLLDDPEPGVQSQAMRFLQNMCSSEQTVIQAVMEWSGGELLTVVAQKLEKVKSRTPDMETAIFAASLHVASNVATGMPVHQEAVMDSGIPEQLPWCLRCEEDKDVRVSAVWCIINLTWKDELPMPGTSGEQAKARAKTLRDLGIEEQLHEMVEDPELDVRERVKTALGFFKDIE